METVSEIAPTDEDEKVTLRRRLDNALYAASVALGTLKQWKSEKERLSLEVDRLLEENMRLVGRTVDHLRETTFTTYCPTCQASMTKDLKGNLMYFCEPPPDYLFVDQGPIKEKV